jgi:hypothetical protein
MPLTKHLRALYEKVPIKSESNEHKGEKGGENLKLQRKIQNHQPNIARLLLTT